MINNKRSAYSWNQFIKTYWKLLENRRLKFACYTFINSLSEAIPFLIAYLLGIIIDFFIRFNSGDSLSPFYYLTIAIGVAGGFQVWLRFYGKNGLKEIAGNIRKETRIAVMSKIMDLELKWHDKEETGSKLQKINEGSDNIYENSHSPYDETQRRFNQQGYRDQRGHDACHFTHSQSLLHP